jgi:hypothetical protein
VGTNFGLIVDVFPGTNKRRARKLSIFKAESGDKIDRLAASFVLPIPLINLNLRSIWPDKESKTNVGMV